MPSNVKSVRRLRTWKFPAYEILLTAFGILIGVFFSQYHYFELDKRISLSDLFIFVLTSFIGIYIANNISRSISHLQSVKALYKEDIKSFILFCKKMEDWLEGSTIPAAELRQHLKQGNMKLRFLKKLYNSNEHINSLPLDTIISKYNNLKTSITDLNTSNKGLIVILNPAQITEYQERIEEIKSDLLNAIINS